MAEPIVLGIVGIKNMGVYDSNVQYEKLNVVTYQGSTYCALQSTKGNLPTDTDYWQLYAEKGGKGDTGDTGPQGPKPIKGVDYYTESDKEDLESDLSNDVANEVSSQLEDLVSATPLVASSVADMTDTTRIYVNTTDGHWYWYNGNTWVDGGIYQSTGISDNSITSDHIKNLSFNKVDNNINTYSLTNADLTLTSNVSITEESDKFVIKRTATNANSHVFITIPVTDITKDLFVELTCENVRAQIRTQIYTGSFKTPKFAFIENGKSIIVIDKNDLVAPSVKIQLQIVQNTYTGVAVNDILATVYKNIKTTNSEYFDYFDAANLSDKLNNLSNYDTIINNKKYIYLNKTYNSQASTYISEIEKSNSFKNFKVIATAAAMGVASENIYETSKYLHIRGKVNENYNQITVFCLVHDSVNNTTKYKSQRVQPGNTFNIIHDLSNYSVYDNMDYFQVVIVGPDIGTFAIEDVEVFVDDISNLEIYADNISGVIKNIQNRLDNLLIEINKNVLTSPNGTNYKIGIDNSGNIIATPLTIVPNKALFIGNSLLVGFGTHGMASYSINDDYYKYVNDYMLTLNPNYTSNKISGGAWESATSESDVNTYINNTLLPNLDTDTTVVFIQLGDNCNTTDRINYITTKAPMLIEAILNRCPSAKIYWIASWYNDTVKQEKIVGVCNSYGIKYINIAPLKTQNNQAYLGYEYIDANGVTKTITNSGVASHPSSVGMRAIADHIIDNLDV